MNNTPLPETPITNHPKLPREVPLIANFHDDRNRLSYYYPLLNEKDGIRAPLTTFLQVNGGKETYLYCDYRKATKFMQDLGCRRAFIRSNFSSAKYDEDGRIITSQDRTEIEKSVLNLFEQLSLSKRHIGGKIAIREYIPHDIEVRYFIRNGEVLYRGSLDSPQQYPDDMAIHVANTFDSLSWSVDFIKHAQTGKWYCIDMGLDGLYHDGTEWIAISEHINKDYSPEKYRKQMADPQRYTYRR